MTATFNRSKQVAKLHKYRCAVKDACDCDVVENKIYQDFLATYESQTAQENRILTMNTQHLGYRRDYLRRIFEHCFEDEIKSIDAAIQSDQVSLRRYKTPTHPCSLCKAAGRPQEDYENVMVSQLQTRSADESMTLEMTCMVCGKQWHRAG